ncbi:hypothetical protein QFC21_006111 [Naganishia friedmannii]|uniref:Uncharacterized protein n=1 Tax=Naganishia friedmannii TaxID=89922 RepID=A0ACC2V4J9_9TREE|nr:hypothetical protein QFC21_006111 [Naganishia friedmannii]
MRLRFPPIATLLTGLASISLAAARGTSYTIHSRLLTPASSAQQQQPFRRTGTVEVDVDVSTFAIALDGNGEVVLPQARWIPLPEQQGGKEAEKVVMDDAWLQVAVQVEGMEEELWPRSVVRAVRMEEQDFSDERVPAVRDYKLYRRL